MDLEEIKFNYGVFGDKEREGYGDNILRLVINKCLFVLLLGPSLEPFHLGPVSSLLTTLSAQRAFFANTSTTYFIPPEELGCYL